MAKATKHQIRHLDETLRIFKGPREPRTPKREVINIYDMGGFFTVQGARGKVVATCTTIDEARSRANQHAEFILRTRGYTPAIQETI